MSSSSFASVLGSTRLCRVIWPVKDSLIAYLRAMPDAVIEGPDVHSGAFVLPGAVDGDVVQCTGTIRLQAHGGELDIVIGDLRITHDGDSGALDARIGTSVTHVTIARLSSLRAVDAHTAIADDVALTHDGAALFQGYYAPYTRLSPLRFEHDTAASPGL